MTETATLIWHCVARGIRKNDIYGGDDDKDFYLRQAARLAREMAVAIMVYTLMDNHFHFLLRATRQTVGRFFLRLHTIYAREFNRRHSFRGHLFECNFRPYPIEGTLRLATASIYIPLNAVKDLGFLRPEDYRFSSHRFAVRPDSMPDWMDMSPVFRVFSPDLRLGRQRYLQAVESRTKMIGKKRKLYTAPPSQAKSRVACEYTDSDLGMILDTLLDPAITHRLSREVLLPSEALKLYTAERLQLGPVRRLAMLLGISNSTAQRYLMEISEEKDLCNALTSLACLRIREGIAVGQER